jgi:iron(III) transport system ATP-binding protein
MLSAKKSKLAVAGKVTELAFLGSHYEVEVALPDTLVTVKTDVCTAAKGDQVYVTFKK